MAKPLKGEELAARIPPGQSLTDKFPVLSYGPTPRFNPATWDFKVFGLVEEPLRFSYEEFRALPQQSAGLGFPLRDDLVATRQRVGRGEDRGPDEAREAQAAKRVTR